MILGGMQGFGGNHNPTICEIYMWNLCDPNAIIYSFIVILKTWNDLRTAAYIKLPGITTTLEETLV